MESVLDLISAACQLLDIDCFLEAFEVSEEFSQALLVALSGLLAFLHSHPFGYGCLVRFCDPRMLILDYIFLPLEKIATTSLRCSSPCLNNLAMTRRFLVTSSLPSHMNC